MRQIGKNVETGTNKVTKRAALVIDQSLVLGTPVKTGRARSNWVVQLISPARSVIEPYAPGDNLGIGETQNAAAALAQGRAVIATRQLGQDIYISNNVDYIGDLNDGSSAQAAAGFVENAIDAGNDVIRSAKILRG